jgi:hypothetical protein
MNPLSTLFAEQRRHRRVQLSLAVRLRWLGPLGPLIETTHTLDASRGGVLVARSERCRVGTLLWVAFPFDATATMPQPETLARVARVEKAAGGFQVALDLEPPQARSRASGGAPAFLGRERRRSERVALALPIRVRHAQWLWPEETMTRDISDEGIRFGSPRLYAAGDRVSLALPPGALGGRWDSREEVPGRVVRIRPVLDSVEQEIAVAALTDKAT